MAGQFQDQVVVITGAAGNLGSAVAKRFAAEEARLVLLDRHADRLEALAAELKVESLALTADLNDAGAVDDAVKQIEARFGTINVLAHTVGGFASGSPVHESEVDLLDKLYNLNVRPIYIVCGRVARHMVEHEVSGKIIMVLAKSALKGQAKAAAYTASKAAAQRLMESMALELRDKGINVNGVLPSTIDTPANREDMPKADFSKWVTPAQLADAIAFLASDEAGAVHGASLEVYGRA